MSANAIAFNRFGLGARSDDSPPAEPRRWLAGRFERFEPRPAPIAAAPAGARSRRCSPTIWRRQEAMPVRSTA